MLQGLALRRWTGTSWRSWALRGKRRRRAAPTTSVMAAQGVDTKHLAYEHQNGDPGICRSRDMDLHGSSLSEKKSMESESPPAASTMIILVNTWQFPGHATANPKYYAWSHPLMELWPCSWFYCKYWFIVWLRLPRISIECLKCCDASWDMPPRSW